jgi:hypothetical protein
MNLEALLKKAETARPLGKPGYGRWKEFYPLYQVLRRRRLSGRDAVEWMVREGAVEEKEKQKAMQSLQKQEWLEKQKSNTPTP